MTPGFLLLVAATATATLALLTATTWAVRRLTHRTGRDQ